MKYGGVCGGGKVRDSFNCGNITVTGKLASGKLYVGGVTGVADGLDLVKSYNTGNVVSLVETTVTHYVGGVAGYLYNVNGQDCYNIGNITGENISNIGALFGKVNSSGTYSNVYYNLNSTISAFGNIEDSEDMRKTEAEMRSTEFINLLNTNTAGAFKQDINNINNGYPILSWQ